MTRTTVSLIIAVLILATGTAMAAEPAVVQTSTTATSTQAAAPTTTVVATDSRELRGELRNLLHRYPPDVGTVLKLDPSLFNDPAYMGTYPTLAEFVSRHPEVARNPGFYLEHVQGLDYPDPNPAGFRMFKEILGAFGGFAIFLILTYVLVWMIKTLIQQRRWSRLSRIQTEVHSKLLDRFTSNEELLAYIQTPAGRRFLESAPIPLEESPQPMSAPLGRISGSLQAGLVTAAAGIGLYIASMRFPTGASEPLFAVAIIAIFVGIAFVLSAGAFFGIYRRFGVWHTPPPAKADAAGE